MGRAADCLITGATGFLGRSLVSLLLQRHTSVRCLVRRRNGLGLPLSWSAAPSVEIVHGNLLSPTDTDRSVDGVRVVYHLAASRGLPATIFAGTVVGSKNLLQAILRVRPERVVLISSLTVYGLAKADPRVPVTEAFGVEEHPEKRDVYAHSKVWQEQIFREHLAGSGIELVVVRPGYIYGPGQKHLPARMGLSLGNLLLQVKPRTPLPLTYVENCADAIVFCGNADAAADETYNIFDDDVPTGSQYLKLSRGMNPSVWGVTSPFWAFTGLAYLNRLAHKATDGHIPLVLTPYRACCAWRGHCFANQKLKNLGWRQPVSTTVALERTFCDRTRLEEKMELPLRGAA